MSLVACTYSSCCRQLPCGHGTRSGDRLCCDVHTVEVLLMGGDGLSLCRIHTQLSCLYTTKCLPLRLQSPQPWLQTPGTLFCLTRSPVKVLIGSSGLGNRLPTEDQPLWAIACKGATEVWSPTAASPSHRKRFAWGQVILRRRLWVFWSQPSIAHRAQSYDCSFGDVHIHWLPTS